MGFRGDSQLVWIRGVFSKAPFPHFLDTNFVDDLDQQLSGGMLSHLGGFNWY
jgi:hypothetical protein